MQGILADINVQGQVEILRRNLESVTWRGYWTPLALPVLTFADVGLAATASDVEVWNLCQRQRLVLITGNRNNTGPDSLENAIRTLNSPSCLPVFTLANPERVRRSAAYAERTALKVLDYLLDMHKYLGTGRLYVP